MILHIKMPHNIAAQQLVKRANIPCFCKIGSNHLFEISFQDPLPEVTGQMEEWDIKMIDARSPAGGGGEYTHYCFGLVSIDEIGADAYRVVDLSFFKNSYPGWFPIIKGGDWCDPVLRHSPEEIAEMEDFESSFGRRKLSKKQREAKNLIAQELMQKKRWRIKPIAIIDDSPKCRSK